MFKVILYDEEDKLIELNTNNKDLIVDIAFSILHYVKCYKDDQNDRYD